MKENVFESLKECVQSTIILHRAIEFPLIHKGHGYFQSKNGFNFKISTIGAGYFHEKMHNIPYKWFTNAAINGKWDMFASVVNESSRMLERSWMCAFYEGSLVGIMSNYNRVLHQTVIDMINENNLQNQVVSYTMDQMALTVNIALNSIEYENVDGKHVSIAGVRITNGHSGHKTLKFSFWFNDQKIDYDGKVVKQSNRHLSNVGLTLNGLSETIAAIRDMKFEDRLNNYDGNIVLMAIRNELTKGNKSLTIRQNKILEFCDGMQFVNAMGLYAFIIAMSKNKGYNTAVNSILKTLLDYIIKD